MGCGQSKGVAPEPDRAKQNAGNSTEGAENKVRNDLDTGSDATSVASAADGAAEPAKQQTLVQEQQPKQHDTASQLTARQDSLDLDTPPVISPTAKQQAAPDPEFDYSNELSSLPAAAAKPAAAAVGASSGRAGLLAPLSSSNTVGGLLSRQPDWLSVSKAPLPPAATYSNSVSGQTAPAQDPSSTDSASERNSSSASAAKDRNSSAGTGSFALPPVSRGFGAAAAKAGGGGSSLPPIGGSAMMQPVSSAAPGSAAATSVALPEPRRLTGNAVLPEPRRFTADLSNKTKEASGDTAADRTSHAGAVRSSRTGAILGGSRSGGAAPDTAAGSRDAVQGSSAGAASLPTAVHVEGDNHQYGTDVEDTNTSAAGRRSSSTQSDQAASQPAAAYDPSDPWSALQSRYVAATNTPSPGDSFSEASSSNLTRVAAGGAAAAAGNPGSRRATSNLAGPPVQLPANRSNELVLVDSDDEDAGLYDEPAADSSSARLQDAGSILQAEHSRRGTDLTQHIGGLSALAGEGSRARVRDLKPAAGGWGDGDMAAAGTLMLGDEESEGRLRKSVMTAAAAHDDVFGDDLPRTNVASGVDSNTRGGGGLAPYARLAGERSSHVVGHGHAAAPSAEEELGVEEIDDVDALIEAELAAKNALPGDLAAKLAQFEALAADDDD